jgi:type IV secretory pathway component VirB8
MHTPDRRTRVLTQEDIEAIGAEIARQYHAQCRFTEISSDDLLSAVRFYKNFNEAMENSKKTVWNTILVLGVGGVISLIILGIFVKLKTYVNGNSI